MGSFLKKAVGIVLAVGLAIAAPALGGALASLIGISKTVATAIATIGLSLVAGAAMSLLAGPPSTKATPFNYRQAISNAWILIGKRRQGGLMVFFHPRKSGSDHYRYFIFASAGHRCKGVVDWMLNNEIVTVDASGMVTSGTYANNAWLWAGRGQYDVDETPAGWRSETGGRWTTSHVGFGIAKIYAKFKMTDDVVQAGMPTISAIWEGSDEIRDPRDGSIGYTNLAIPAFYWWLQLPREENGYGALATEIPDDSQLAAWTAICDEDVDNGAGGTEKRYAFDSLIEAGSKPSDIRETFMRCMAGSYCYSEGKHLMRPGYWVPVSDTLSDEDLAGPITLNMLRKPEEMATDVSGTFIDPDANYQSQPVPTRRRWTNNGDGTWTDRWTGVTRSIAPDVNQADYELPHITSHTRGQRILEIMLWRAQCEKQVSWVTNITGLAVQPMQTVRLDTTRHGLGNYAFVIDSWALTPPSKRPAGPAGQDDAFTITLGLREESPDIYAPPPLLAKSGIGVPDPAEPIKDPPPELVTNANNLTDGSLTYSATTVKNLLDRVTALENPS